MDGFKATKSIETKYLKLGCPTLYAVGRHVYLN